MSFAQMLMEVVYFMQKIVYDLIVVQDFIGRWGDKMLDIYDYLYIVCTTIIKTIIIFIGGALLYCLIAYNHSLGISWADNMGIPYDMALTVTSLGFVNNVMVVFTVFDLIIFGVIINQLNKYKTKW